MLLERWQERVTQSSRGALTSIVRIMSLPIGMLPVFPTNLFYVSICLSIVFMVLLAWASSNLWPDIALPHSRWLDDLTFVLDPWGIQLLWGLLISCWVFFVGRHAHSTRVRLASGFLPWILLLVCYAVGDLLFKPALGYARPSGQLVEPPLTNAIRELLDSLLGNGESNATPSGFVVRQLALFYLLWIVQSQPWSRVRSSIWFWIWQLLNLAVLLLISFLRLYREAHTIFDLSLSIGVGTVILWLILVPMYRAASAKYQQVLVSTGLLFIALVAVIFYYARNPAILIQNASIVLVGFILFYGVVEWVSPAPAREDQKLV